MQRHSLEGQTLITKLPNELAAHTHTHAHQTAINSVGSAVVSDFLIVISGCFSTIRIKAAVFDVCLSFIIRQTCNYNFWKRDMAGCSKGSDAQLPRLPEPHQVGPICQRCGAQLQKNNTLNSNVDNQNRT